MMHGRAETKPTAFSSEERGIQGWVKQGKTVFKGWLKLPGE